MSFDCNYRSSLWERWDGDPRAILLPLVDTADILFGDHRDFALLLGRPFSGAEPEGPREAADAAFAAFPRLRLIASTQRSVEDVDRHRISARLESRDDVAQTEEIVISGIVDRIGTGDAFAAGVLHKLRCGGSLQETVRTGLGLSALKHSLPGDASLFDREDLISFEAKRLDVMR